MKKVVFFDFDGTLVKFDSFIKFARFSLSLKNFVKGLLYSMPWLIGWKLRICSSSKAKQHLFNSWFKGWDLKTFDSKCNEFSPIIEEGINGDIIKLLHDHQISGCEIVIVSASIGNWIRPWASLYSINDVLATELEIDKYGKLTGMFSTLNCLGQEKVNRILSKYGDINEYESWAYSDSDNDLPLLSIVNHGFKVPFS